MSETRMLQLRGYRRVFQVERRLFRFDRWRIPYPHGIPLRGIGYFLLLEIGAVLASQAPLLGALVGLLPPALLYLGLPLLGSFALMGLRIDGRAPHHALFSLARWWVSPHWLAGLDPCPPGRGEEVAPLEDVAVAYDARESFAVRGRIRGPAKVTFRYPATVRFGGAPPWVRDPGERRARARRFRVRRRGGAEPMLRGKAIGVPRGSEVVIE